MANAFLLAPLAPVGTPAALTTVEAGLPAHAFNDYAGVTVQLRCDGGGTGAAISFDLGADVQFDTVMVFGVELLPQSGSGFNINWATSAQGNFTGSFSTDGSGSAYAGSVLPTSGKGVSMLMLSAPVSARYLRLNWSAGTTGQSIRFSRIVVGKRFQPSRNFSFGAQPGVRDLGSADFSSRGVLLRYRGKKLRTIALPFDYIKKDEAEATSLRLIEQLGNTETVALCTDPAADPQRQNRCYFGTLVGDLGHVWAKASSWQLKVNLVSFF